MPEISSAALFVLAGAAGAAEGLAFLVLVSFWAAATTTKTRRKTAIFLRYFVRINVNELKRILIPKPGFGQPNGSKAWVIGKLARGTGCSYNDLVIRQPQCRILCRFKELAAILAVFFALPGITQVDKNVHNVKIVLPNDVSLDNVDAEYVLFGSFGDHEGSVRTKPDLRIIEVNPFVDGVLAEKLKVFIW